MNLPKNSQIISVVPEFCAGPGWSNQIVWVIYKTSNGEIKEEVLQMEEWHQSDSLYHLFSVGALVNKKLIEAANKLQQKED